MTAVLSAQIPVQAAPAGSEAAAMPSIASHPVHRVCATVAKSTEAACQALERDDVKQTKAQVEGADAAPSGLGPADLAAAYRLPSGDEGAGQTVAIVDAYDNPDAESELATYRSEFGLPPCTTANGCFKKTDQNGGTDYPAADSGWSGEIALDVQMVSAVCPRCNILLVEADDASLLNLGAAVNQAVAQGAKFVSNSYGGAESGSDTQSDEQYFDHPGVVITASTGDDGYGVSYPASSPHVTAVGGTSLVKNTSVSRGWSEAAWDGTGSGCSGVQPKPSVQTDTGCARRSVADVSAVADPNTGVAVYNAGAWHVYGGTSASSPIIASVYALAGNPPAASDPMTFPYARTADLNDITTGSNGSCGSYLCNAGAGYDGPTGLGTPNGVAAFSAGPHAVVSGTVTDAATGKPLTGAEVTVGDETATTTTAGTYQMAVAPGTYDVSVAKFGYATVTFPGVTLADGQTLNEDAELTAKAMVNVTGTVKDASGHGWPLYAGVQVEGVPSSAVHTDPATGRYRLSVPEDGTYTLRTTSAYPGYAAPTAQVTVGSAAVTQDFGVKVDPATCTAAGYAYRYSGSTEDFSTASAATPPTGWTVTDALGAGRTWRFDDPGARGDHTGGSGTFAIMDSAKYGPGVSEDTSLVSPVYDFSDVSDPFMSYGSSYWAYSVNSTADVDLSLDGGTTWQNVSRFTTVNRIGARTENADLAAAAGHSDVRIRFHFAATAAHYWQVDDVFVGNRPCAPTTGGLVIGQVLDKNTGAGVAGASVVSADRTSEGATSLATPDDPALKDGFYWFVSTLTGTHPVNAAAPLYKGATATPDITADQATTADVSLGAGRLSVTPSDIATTVAWQGRKSATVTVTNTGSAQASLKLGERDKGFSPQDRAAQPAGAAVQEIPGHYSPGFLNPATGTKAATVPTSPAAEPWTSIADFPTSLMDNAVATGDDGKVYSVTGATSSTVTSAGYVYDPATLSWAPIADSVTPREAGQAAFVDGRLFVTGGWDATGVNVASLRIYDPRTNTWTSGAPDPRPMAGAASAVIDGKWYLIGGCSTSCGTTTVEVYDTDTDSWSTAAAYPRATSWLGCGAIDRALYCGGGTASTASSKAAYTYDPSADAWTALPDMPYDLWGTGAVGANGKLLLSGGITDNSATLTNKGVAYDPSTNAWSNLPNSNYAVYRGGSACGFYKVGGSVGSFSPTRSAELLPGYGQCGTPADASWLSEETTSLTLAPGESKTVTVTVDASGPEIGQPGTYAAQLKITHDTPYQIAPITVAMNVKPPKTWGKISGTVSGTDCSGNTAGIRSATVQIDSGAESVTLKTDAAGAYEIWMDARHNPLNLIAAKDGWAPKAAAVKLVKGATVTEDFTLKPDRSCP